MKKRNSHRTRRRIQAEFGTAGEKKTRVGFTTNLSPTGMFVGSNSPYPVGTLVKVKLLLDEPLALDTIVVHAKKGLAGAAGIIQSGMGLRLLKPEPRLESALGSAGSVRESAASSDSASAASSGSHSEAPDRTARGSQKPATSGPTEPKEARIESQVPEPPLHTADREDSAARDPKTLPVASSEVIDLEERLAESKNERERLEEMLEADEREKQMLRQLVSQIENKRDQLAAKLAAAQAEASSAATHRIRAKEMLEAQAAETRDSQNAAEHEAGALRRKIADLEVALADARATPASELPQRVVANRRSPLTSWVMLIAGAVLGGLVVLLLPGLQGARFDAPATARTDVGGAAKPAEEKHSAGEVAGNEIRDELASSEVTSTPEATPVPSSRVDPLVAAEETVRAWAAAWSEQRVDEYLSHYATSFEPPAGMTLDEWRSNRGDRLTRPEWIRVNLGPIETTVVSDDRVTLTFDQGYETPTYRDSVRKSLDLAREQGAWKIAAERVQK